MAYKPKCIRCGKPKRIGSKYCKPCKIFNNTTLVARPSRTFAVYNTRHRKLPKGI